MGCEYKYKGKMYSREDLEKLVSSPNFIVPQETFFDPKEVRSDFHNYLVFKQDLLQGLKDREGKIRKEKRLVSGNKKATQKLVKQEKLIKARVETISREVANLEEAPTQSVLSLFAENDFNRVEQLIDSSDISDIKEAKEIINFYKAIRITDAGIPHPLFTQDELFFDDESSRFTDKDKEFYNDLADKATKYGNDLYIKDKELLESIINENTAVQNMYGELAYEQIVSSKKGLKDLNWIDMYIMDINQGIFSSNGIIPQVSFSLLQDSVNKQMAIASKFQKEIDGVIPDVEEILKGKGQGLGGLGINGVSYDLFKQKDSNGLETGRLLHRYSPEFYDARKTMTLQFQYEIDKAANLDETNRKEAYKKAFHKKQNWFRANTIVINPAMLSEVTTNPKYSQFSKYFVANEAESKAHTDKLKEILGQQGYQENINNQLKVLDKFIADYEGRKEILSKEELHLFDAMYNPFIGSKNFYSQTENKVNKQVVSPRMEYNVSVPRKNIGQITGITPEQEYIFEDTNTSTGYYDKNFSTIEADPTLNNFYKLATKELKTIRESLPVELQEKLQINSLPAFEKSITELVLESSGPLDKFMVALKNFWERMKSRFAINIQSEISHAKLDPLTGKPNYKLNDSFINETKGKASVLRSIEYARLSQALGFKIDKYTTIVSSNLNNSSLSILAEYLNTDANQVKSKLANKFTPSVLIDKFVNHTLAQQKSFDLPKVLKLYSDLAYKYIARNEVKPMIDVLKNHYEQIKAPSINNVNQPIINARTSTTQFDDVRKRAISQMQDWYDRVVLGNYGITHSGVLKVIEDHIGDEKTRSKRFLDSMSAFSQGKVKKFYTQDEKVLKQKLEAIIAKEKDPETIESLTNKIDELGKNYTVTSIIDGMLNFVRFKGLGFNLPSSITNLFEGISSNLIIAATGDYFKPDSMFRGMRIARGSIRKNLTAGKFASSDSKKLSIVMANLQLLQDSTNELQKASAKSTYSKLGTYINPYEINKRTEYLIQSPLIVASLLETPITNNKGETSNVWDALDNQGKLKEEYKNEENISNWEHQQGKQFLDFMTSTEDAITKAHGNYNELRGMMAKSSTIGKIALMFKTWMTMGIHTRFATKQDDLLLGDTYKGRYKSLTASGGSIFGSLIGLGAAGLTGAGVGLAIGTVTANILGGSTNTNLSYLQETLFNLQVLAKKAAGIPINIVAGKELVKSDTYEQFISSSFTARDAKNMNANLTEMAILLQLLASMVLVKATLFDEEDEKDSTERQFHNILMNKLMQLSSNTATYADPNEFVKSISNTAFLSFLNDTKKTIGATAKYLQGTDVISTGVNAGESRLGNQLNKTLVPGIFRSPFTLGFDSLRESQYFESGLDYYFTSDEKIQKKIIRGQRAVLRRQLEDAGLDEDRANKIVNKRLPFG